MNRLLRGFAAPLLIGLGLACTSLAARAHKASDAYLTLRVDGERIEQRLDIALRDLDRDLVLDADGDGALTWGEVRSRWDEIEHLVNAGVAVSADGSACTPLRRAAPLLDEHVDGRHAVLQRTLRCAAAPGALAIDYRLFATSDPTHRGIARVLVGEAEPLTRVLTPGGAATPVALSSSAGPSAATHGFAGFFAEGLAHIASGADHVLFLVTLLMVAVWRRSGNGWMPREQVGSAWREALRLVTAFTAAHSLTLGLAAAGVLAPPTRWVESLIAISVFVAAIDNLRPFLPGPRWMTVAAFGLVHGFGFAGPLQDLGLLGGELALPLLGFNLGVEAGQLLLVVLLLPLALHLRATAAYRRWIVRLGSAMVAVLAALWTLERALALPGLGR